MGTSIQKIEQEIDAVWSDHRSLVKEKFAEKADENEFKLFEHICRKSGLNPLANEIFFVKYSQGKAGEIIVARDGYLKRAESFDSYDGFQSGWIVEGQKVISIPQGKKPEAAYCEVYLKNRKMPSLAVF